MQADVEEAAQALSSGLLAELYCILVLCVCECECAACALPVQADVAETAQALASSGGALTELCALLPAAVVAFGDVPARQELCRRAAEMDAGRDAWLWASTVRG